MDGVSVPEGIVLSAELYKRLREGDVRNPRFQRKIIFSLRQYVDRLTDGRFGNPSDPVLLSVRSGAVFSMPGVMDTITNVGITQDVIDYYARQDPWFAYDCYRRLIHDFALSYYGMDRALYERLMTQAKEEAAVDLKEKLTGRQMEILTKKYRYAINRPASRCPRTTTNSSITRSWRCTSRGTHRWRATTGSSSTCRTSGARRSSCSGWSSGTTRPIPSPGSCTATTWATRTSASRRVQDPRAGARHRQRRGARLPDQRGATLDLHRLRPFSSMERSYPEQYRKVYDAVKRIRERWGNEVEIEFTLENDTL